MSEIKIKKERILKAAKNCNQTKQVLRTLFPEVFEEDYFDFSNCEHVLTYEISDDFPLYIGQLYMPNGLFNKCLVVNNNYELQVGDKKGKTILTFKKVH